MAVMTVILSIIGVFVILGLIRIMKHSSSLTRNLMVLFIISIPILVYFYTLRRYSPCKRLHSYGFRYKKLEGSSPTWDVFLFSFEGSGRKASVKGPRIKGDRLKITCVDINNDDIPEFIIQSQVWETYKTILQVNIESGIYHVKENEGLKIYYAQEGYYHD